MQTRDLTRINDWNIKDFLVVMLSVHLAMLGLIGIDLIGLDYGVCFGVLRQIVGFIYLFFIPGFALLRVFRVHNLDRVETILLVTGISLAFTMFVGLLTNLLYPAVSKPLSLSFLTATLTIFTLLLCILSYYIDKDFSSPASISLTGTLIVRAIFLLSLPVFSFFGVLLVNSSGNNTLLLVLVSMIAVVVFLLAFSKRIIPESLYPLAVVSIALALILHITLISDFLVGSDVHLEYYVFKVASDNSYWNAAPFASPDPVGSYNAMLSITMLPLIYSRILNLDGVLIFKVVYPLIFSLVPLALYKIYETQTNKQVAFLSAFFLMAHYTFYNEMPSVNRQIIAQLFLVLLVYLFFNYQKFRSSSKYLAIVFGVALVISHYATSYIFIFYIFLAWVLLKNTHERISGTYVLLYVGLTLAWYIYVTPSTILSAIEILEHVGTNILYGFFKSETTDPNIQRAFGMGSSFSMSPGRYVSLVLYYTTQAFIFVGFVWILRKRLRNTFNKKYAAFSFVSMFMVLTAIFLPYASKALNITRLYFQTLFFLAPFCIIGGGVFWVWVSKFFEAIVFRNKKNLRNRSQGIMLVSVILVMFFFYNVGFIFEITNDYPSSISLSKDNMDKVLFDSIYTYPQEVSGAIWLSENAHPRYTELRVLADRAARMRVLSSYGMIERKSVRFLSKDAIITDGAYIYLRRLNVVNGLVSDPESPVVVWEISEISSFLHQQNKLYSNGGCNIYIVVLSTSPFEV